MAARSSSRVGFKRKKELRAPDPFLLRTMQGLEWVQARKRTLVPAVIVVVVVGAAIAAWSWVGERKEARAAASLARALEVANATIRSPNAAEEETPREESDDSLVFQSERSRAKAALNAYRRVLKNHADSSLAASAKLGEASSLYDLEELDDAKRAYEQVLQMTGVSPDLRALAVEGVVRCLEEKGNLAEALQQLDGLRTMESGAFKELAQYGRARILQRQGRFVQARELFRAVLDSLNAEDAPDRPYLRTQIEARMRELESRAPADAVEGEGRGGAKRGKGRGRGGERSGDRSRSKRGKSR